MEFLMSSGLVTELCSPSGSSACLSPADLDALSADYVLDCVKSGGVVDVSKGMKKYNFESSYPVTGMLPRQQNQKAKPAEVTKNAKPADDEEDDSDSEGMDDEDDSDDDEEIEEEEKTPTPKKPESSKKRSNEAAPKTHVSSKKAKVAVTPQKTDEKKKGGHTATPHPAKKGGKNPTTATQSPKSAVSCGTCKKTFNSGNALESHNKAKHAAAK